MSLWSKVDVTKYAFSPKFPEALYALDYFTVEVEGTEYLTTNDWADAAQYWLHQTDPERDARIYCVCVQ